MNWLGEHWASVLGIVGGLHAIAKVVVHLTPTDTDNKILAAVEKIFRVVGLQPKGNG